MRLSEELELMMELPCVKLGGMVLTVLHTITVSAIFISHLVILQLSWRLSYSVPKPTVARRHGAYCRHRSHSRSRCLAVSVSRAVSVSHCRRHGGQISSFKGSPDLDARSLHSSQTQIACCVRDGGSHRNGVSCCHKIC